MRQVSFCEILRKESSNIFLFIAHTFFSVMPVSLYIFMQVTFLNVNALDIFFVREKFPYRVPHSFCHMCVPVYLEIQVSLVFKE